MHNLLCEFAIFANLHMCVLSLSELCNQDEGASVWKLDWNKPCDQYTQDQPMLTLLIFPA